MDSNVTMFDKSVEKSSFELKKGDVMKSISIGTVYFEEWKRGMQSYVCVEIASGKRYKSRVRNAYEQKFTVIGTYKIETTADKFGNDSKNLVKDDLFIIEKKNSCEIFKFIDYGRTGKINACSVLDDTKIWGIDKSFTCIKVENLI